MTIYASGVRNAFDLVWTRAGYLYAPTNGSAAGGSTPSFNGTFSGTRIDGRTYTGKWGYCDAEPDTNFQAKWDGK